MTTKILPRGKELSGMLCALYNWLQTQDISPPVASHVMMTASGAIIGLAVGNRDDLERALELLETELKRSARDAFADKMELKK